MLLGPGKSLEKGREPDYLLLAITTGLYPIVSKPK